MRPGETPVPIPNTTVKAWAADGTTLETAWESRRAPEQKRGCSSVGRAPALQAGGREFESLHLQLGLTNGEEAEEQPSGAIPFEDPITENCKKGL